MFDLARLSQNWQGPERRDIVDGLLDGRGIAVLTGGPRTGKSTFASCLAADAAQGRPFLGRACQPSLGVVLAKLDSGLPEAQGELDPAPTVHPSQGALSYSPQKRPVTTELRPSRVHLLIIETGSLLTIGHLHTGYFEATEFLKTLLRRFRAFEGCVLLGGKHHQDVTIPRRPSPTIWRSLETILTMRRSDKTLLLRAHHRGRADHGPVVVTLDSERHTITMAGTPQEGRDSDAARRILDVVSRKGVPMSAKQIRSEVRLRSALVTKVLRDLVDKGALVRVSIGWSGPPTGYQLPNLPLLATGLLWSSMPA